MKAEHKGKKKDNLGWEIIKLQAQVGESTSRKAKKVVEAERKKEHHGSTTKTEEATEEAAQEQESAALSEAAQKLLKLKEVKISQKIFHAKKEIRKAFVKAKAFETQRLVKRLREARKAVEEKENKGDTNEEDKPAHKKKQDLTQEDVTKFENEIELVKKMDMDSLSEHAFVAKLAKHPILGSHTLMAPYSVATTTKKDATQEDAGTAATIQIIEARLTNTKTVKEHMSKLWDELEHIVTGKKANEAQNKKRKAGEDQDESKNKKRKNQKDTKESSNESDNEDEDEDEDVAMADMSDISDSEHEDDGYDSDGLPLPKGGKSGSSSSSMSSMFIGSLNAGKKDKKDKKDKKGKKDKNDWVDDKFDEIYGKVKKNRPGQQARRAKAERKYGKEANHVKKAEEEARIRAEKKAARKAKQEKFSAARDASTANAQRLPNRRTIGAGDGSASIVQPKQNNKPKTPSGPDLNDPTLHPSWIAKQTEKAAMAAALSGAKSNKITFDDSD
ncbi:hypothetical protein BGX33_003525 [Mortierella sp. NVP41]|nr:hypothetical protein BGX33_003525 [Mortierella sp. NVP41]